MEKLLKAVLIHLKETKELAEEVDRQRTIIINEMKEMNNQLYQLNEQLRMECK